MRIFKLLIVCFIVWTCINIQEFPKGYLYIFRNDRQQTIGYNMEVNFINVGDQVEILFYQTGEIKSISKIPTISQKL